MIQVLITWVSDHTTTPRVDKISGYCYMNPIKNENFIIKSSKNQKLEVDFGKVKHSLTLKGITYFTTEYGNYELEIFVNDYYSQDSNVIEFSEFKKIKTYEKDGKLKLKSIPGAIKLHANLKNPVKRTSSLRLIKVDGSFKE